MIVGRKEEIAELDKLYYSDRPEFVAIYGRRRVGKTFLIKQALKDRITFQHTGVSPVDQDNDRNRLKTQLESFYYALLNQGLEGYRSVVATSKYNGSPSDPGSFVRSNTAIFFAVFGIALRRASEDHGR